MKVYIVQGCYDHEGFSIEGVFAKKEDAEELAVVLRLSRMHDDVEVSEYELK